LLNIDASNETVFKEPRDACARIWDHIEPSLPPYLQRFATNVGYLRRTKEEADKDRQARQIEFDEWEGRVFDDPDTIFDSQAEENSLVPEQLSRNDFQHGFLDTLNVWARQGFVIGSLEGGCHSTNPSSHNNVMVSPHRGQFHDSLCCLLFGPAAPATAFFPLEP
jgi:hypothetical protein